jgi:hypothetical protein
LRAELQREFPTSFPRLFPVRMYALESYHWIVPEGELKDGSWSNRCIVQTATPAQCRRFAASDITRKIMVTGINGSRSSARLRPGMPFRIEISPTAKAKGKHLFLLNQSSSDIFSIPELVLCRPCSKALPDRTVNQPDVPVLRQEFRQIAVPDPVVAVAADTYQSLAMR